MNKIESIEADAFKMLNSLRKLNLDGNLLTKIHRAMFSGGTHNNMYELSIKANKIENIEDESFNELNLLKKFDLSQNKLTKIGVKTFLGLNELENFNLSKNRVNKIEMNSFLSLTNLKKLDFRFNNLEKFRKCYFFNGLKENLEFRQYKILHE